MNGYLVVLASKSRYLQNPLNTKYKGVDRLPPYSPNIQEDKQALDAYVFGDFKDDTGVIPQYDKAKQLLDLFGESRHKFEIIYCESVSAAGVTSNRKGDLRFLGHDVAASGGGFWSIVGDFPVEKEMRHFLEALNESGLFNASSDAEAFLQEYCTRKLADYDSALEILGVYAFT